MAVDYNEPILMTYTWTAQAFGAASITKKVRAPAGKKARIFDANVLPTVTFAGTTSAFIIVGDAGSSTRILNTWTMANTAAGTLVTKPTDTMMQRLGSNVTNWAYVDVNTDILIVLSTAVGGSPAGTADVSITFAFY